MAIETLEDIAEEMADGLGVYGACDEKSCNTPNCCRVTFVPMLVGRMRQAAEIERRLERTDGE